jgi:PadR family transcriptional regulator AphA
MPSVLDHIVLALICEKPQHGFAISKELDTDESLVSVMKVRRPLVYRSINSLETAGLVKPTKTEAGTQGSERTVYSPTARGKATSAEWLDSIVDHPRDARIELLAKFVLRGRSNMSNTALPNVNANSFRRLQKISRFASTPQTQTQSWLHAGATNQLTP